MKRLAVVTTHPIQYYAPVFKQLAGSGQVELKVFYTWGKESIKKFDPDFGKEIEWDIPLLDGYDYEFLDNVAADPGSHHFKGIDTPKGIETIKNFNPDAILVYGWAWKAHLKIIRHFSGKKAVWFRGDSTMMGQQSFFKKLLRWVFLRWIYNHVNMAFFVGSANKKYFLTYGLRERQLLFAPHAIDNLRFSHVSDKKPFDLRKDLLISTTDVVILFAGKLESTKDPFVLLKAFKETELTGVHLVFVGNGHLEKELKADAKRAIKQSQIHFIDFQNQAAMPSIYQAVDLFCLPSIGETWGLAVNEAMAAGKAILISNKVGCVSDLVEPGINGEVFVAGDALDLREKISLMCKNPSLLQQMGEASRRIIEKWSFEAQTAIILAAMKKLP